MKYILSKYIIDTILCPAIERVYLLCHLAIKTEFPIGGYNMGCPLNFDHRLALRSLAEQIIEI